MSTAPTFTATINDQVRARPDELFRLITDVERLPQWNAHIPKVVQAPAAPLSPDVEWVVRMRAMGSGWDSRATCVECDRASMRFAHRSRTDDGNPSYALWDWQLTPSGDRTDISVRYELHPKTFWRRKLFARIRHRQLQKEIRASLRAAEALLATSSG
jgi:uncharacterized protein YndB with AHSA1/START domain